MTKTLKILDAIQSNIAVLKITEKKQFKVIYMNGVLLLDICKDINRAIGEIYPLSTLYGIPISNRSVIPTNEIWMSKLSPDELRKQLALTSDPMKMMLDSALIIKTEEL